MKYLSFNQSLSMEYGLSVVYHGRLSKICLGRRIALRLDLVRVHDGIADYVPPRRIDEYAVDSEPTHSLCHPPETKGRDTKTPRAILGNAHVCQLRSSPSRQLGSVIDGNQPWPPFATG